MTRTYSKKEICCIAYIEYINEGMVHALLLLFFNMKMIGGKHEKKALLVKKTFLTEK